MNLPGPVAIAPASAAAAFTAAFGADALESRLVRVEQHLGALGAALRRHDSPAIEAEARELHTALGAAVDHFTLAARHGALPPELRQRLARAGGEVARQRDSVTRASLALDRVLETLMPAQTTGHGAGYSSLASPLGKLYTG
ncbi:MAG: hypothetical protein ABI574_09090 [Burkholderiales bacterium]